MRCPAGGCAGAMCDAIGAAAASQRRRVQRAAPVSPPRNPGGFAVILLPDDDGHRLCGRDLALRLRGPALAELDDPLGSLPPDDHPERESEEVEILELHPGREGPVI